MESEWAEGVLADACGSIDYGLTESASNENIGPRFLRITDIVSGHIDWKTVPHVAANDATVEKYRLYNADVVIARTGASTGSSAYVSNPPPAVFASYLIRLRVRPPFDARFIAYYLQSKDFWEFIRGVLGDKSAQPNASASTMTKAPLKYPQSQAEQRAIAQILGTLDDKIELNRRMSGTLEAMARALFKSWFVDFDTARAKVEGRAVAGQGARLFPDFVEDSGLGEIPDGWKSGTLADVSILNPESWSKATRPAVIRYVDLAGTKWGRIESVASLDADDAPSRAQRVLRPLDTIVGTVRPGNGSFAFISEDGLTGSTGFAVLRPSRPEYAEFVYLAATAPENIDALAHLADGGAYPAVRPDVVAATPTVLPPDKVLSAFSKVVQPLLARAAANEDESRTLAALRDTLLPKLISGELRVKDPEKLVSKARQGVVAKR